MPGGGKLSRDETPIQPIRSAPVRVYLDGKSEVVHPIDLKDWTNAGWGLDPETTSAVAPEGSEGGNGAAPAGGAEGAPGGKKKDKAKGAASPAAPAGGAEGAESLEDLI
jgi:hypothetical protein